MKSNHKLNMVSIHAPENQCHEDVTGLREGE